MPCKYTHHAIATTLEPVREHALRPEQVRRVTVATNTMGATHPFTLGDCVERFMTAAGAAVRPLLA